MKSVCLYVFSLLLAFLSLNTFAEVDEEVTVVGTRTERSINDLASTVNVIASDRIEEELTRDIADLVRFEPGVSVGGTGSRFGLSGFSIRGIGGNRVLTMVDGIRIPAEYSFGGFMDARRDFVDIDSLDRAEIARGPVSSVWGSDALGGVVSFTTKSANDLLEESETAHVSAKAGYSSVDSSTLGTLTLAGRKENVSGLLIYTRREGEETENGGGGSALGPAREAPDEQDIETNNLLAKLSWAPSEGHELIVSVDYFESETDTNILSDAGTSVFGTRINDRITNDEKERTRYSLSYQFDGEFPLASQVRASIYHQESESVQLLTESRTPPPFIANQTRTRLSTFEQEIDGITIQATKEVQLGETEHTIVYGLDYYETSVETLRNGGIVDSAGAVVPERLPFPTRGFPTTEVDNLAFFLQDEISLLDGKLLLTPGVRFDDFEANPVGDAIYLDPRQGNPVPSPFDDSEVSAKFGALYRFTDSLSMFAVYSEGFRAPPFDDVNVGFTNFASGYTTLPNPDLESETSESWELGLRLSGDYYGASLALFTNDYENFIESFAAVGFDPLRGLLLFQSTNRGEVEIEGAELKLEADLEGIGLDNFSFKAAIAYAEGEDLENDTPLNSVEPLTAVFGLAYDAPNGKWGTNLVWTLVKNKDISDIENPLIPGSPVDPRNIGRLPTAGDGILDLMAFYKVNEKFEINAGVYNLTDKEYIRWIDTGSIGLDSSERFTQPGINGSITLRFTL